MARWLVTGGRGMLGRDLVRVLRSRGEAVTGVGHHDLDITDASAIKAAITDTDIVINTAAWTDVDAAEVHEAAATNVNGHAVANLAAGAEASGAILIHLSTDYVFSGDATTPYREDAAPAPINAYGRSKVAGEVALRRLAPTHGYLVRAAWLYGATNRNFVSAMLRLAAEREYVDVVDDQRGQPTWSYTLAERLADLGAAARAGTVPAGVYHAAATGSTTWFELAKTIFANAGLDPSRVRPISSEQLGRPARRPSYSVLACDRWLAAGLRALPPWRDMLAAAMPGIVAGLDSG